MLTLALRAPWFDAPLGRDEAGVSMVARAWHQSHPFPYGPYFLDRPPLLVLAYRLANDAGGATGVRVLGMIAATLIVVVCTLLAARVAGRRAALPAALLAGGLSSSVLLDSVFTPAELLAVIPSAASVLLLLCGLGRDRGAGWWLAGAGACAALALLVKQSFGDALVAGVVGLLIAAWMLPWRRTAARAAAYAGGVAGVGVGVLAWERLAHTAHPQPRLGRLCARRLPARRRARPDAWQRGDEVRLARAGGAGLRDGAGRCRRDRRNRRRCAAAGSPRACCRRGCSRAWPAWSAAAATGRTI